MNICAKYVQIVKGKCTYCVYLQKDFRIIYYVSQNCTFCDIQSKCTHKNINLNLGADSGNDSENETVSCK